MIFTPRKTCGLDLSSEAPPRAATVMSTVSPMNTPQAAM
jgi:hypothetical protein